MLRNKTAFLFLLTPKGSWRTEGRKWAEAWLRLGDMPSTFGFVPSGVTVD